MAKEYVEQVYINHSEKLYDIRDAEAEHLDNKVNSISQNPDLIALLPAPPPSTSSLSSKMSRHWGIYIL